MRRRHVIDRLDRLSIVSRYEIDRPRTGHEEQVEHAHVRIEWRMELRIRRIVVCNPVDRDSGIG
jgi:hypothetical protein